MKYAILLNSVLPLRAEPNERSEMVSQMLFGEYCRVLESYGSFVKIENYTDNYIGWADKLMLSELSEETFCALQDNPVFRVNVPIADVFCMTDKSIYRLSAGSLLPFYNHETSSFEVAGVEFQIHPSFVTYIPCKSKQNIVATAMLLINTPYLWGGKSIFGIDCSGFCQTVFSLNGYNIPRDTSSQVDDGVTVSSLTESEINDLIFFKKNDKICHVGIYLGNNKIIHASGKVRIDKMDEVGIYNNDTQQYTHHYATIKRI